jgi:Mn2+/Fe2+ NRAMP family transporter
MGIRIPRIVSPITGEEEARPSFGYKFPVNEENMRRWRNWWKVANQEQLITFYILGLATLIGLSVLLYSALGIVKGGEAEITFLQEEVRALAEQLGTWFEYFFYLAGFAILFSTNVGMMDWVSRLTADSLKVNFLARSEFWSESKIYVTVVWIMAIGGSLIIWTGIEPLILLVLSATGGGFMMFFYSGPLILLNRRFLPDPIKLKSWRLVGLSVAFLIYAAFVVYIIYQMVTTGPASLA